jgi:hypothetical protein
MGAGDSFSFLGFPETIHAVSRAPAATPEAAFTSLAAIVAMQWPPPYDAMSLGPPRVLTITDDTCFEGCEKPLPTGSAKP